MDRKLSFSLSNTSNANFIRSRTETGPVAESTSRPADDPYWNYLRFYDSVYQNVWMKPVPFDADVDGGWPSQQQQQLYECVYLASHQGLSASNSDSPPGSFHSRDIFTPHPSLPNRWKYVTRMDDRITLINGEKVLPLPIEGLIRQHPLVQDVVVVGANRVVPGLLVFLTDAASNDRQMELLSDTEMELEIEMEMETEMGSLKDIWPIIAEANSKSEKFSQISRDAVLILPFSEWLSCPRTDKGTLIRHQVNGKYAHAIDHLYNRLEDNDSKDNSKDIGGESAGKQRLSLDETKARLMELCQGELDLPVHDVFADFFNLGVDSLKAIQLRRIILQEFASIDGSELRQSAIYETGNVSRLAEKIFMLQNGNRNGSGDGQDAATVIDDDEQKRKRNLDDVSLMSDLISKYSKFRPHVPYPRANSGDKMSVVSWFFSFSSTI